MAAFSSPPSLLDRLPPVRGRYESEGAIGRYTWFRVGGPAEVLFRPADVADLANFLAGKPDNVPVTVLGAGSNLLIRDGGIAGVVIRLGRPFANIRCDGTTIQAGAMALDYNVAKVARDAGVAGFEFMAGIPGTAVTVNALLMPCSISVLFKIYSKFLSAMSNFNPVRTYSPSAPNASHEKNI